jgi:hypothetical protein
MTISVSNTFGVSVVSSAGLPAWRASAPLTTYYAIPNTAFTNHTQSPQLPFPYVRGGPGMIIDAWGAIAHSASKKKLFAFGGGHTDYAGNDAYEFNYGADSPSWTLIKSYTPAAQIVQDARRYNDGNPVSTHTYYNLFFIDQMDEMIVHGLDAIYISGNSPYSVVERFTYSTKTWRPIVDCPTIERATGPGVGKAKHPVTEEIYWVDLSGGFQLRKYNPITGVATALGSSQAISIYAALCIDPIRNRALRTPFQGGGGWAQIGLSNGATASVSLTGDSIANPSAGQLVWDSIGERYIHVDKNCELTAINPTTYVATRISVAGTPPPAAMTGFHSRSVFDATMKGIFTIPTASASVYFIKLYA